MAVATPDTDIATKIMSKLLDKKFINRWGTSVKENITHDYEERLNKKYEILKEEFRRINKDENDYIDIEELRYFLKTYEDETGKTLPDKYCEKLFYLIDVNHDDKITIQEFVSSYMLLEERLKLKRLRLRKLMEEVDISIQETLEKREKHLGEKLNAFGVVNDAIVNLDIMEARDLRPMDFNGKSDPYCIITINGKHKQVSTYKPNTLNPIWNETFLL